MGGIYEVEPGAEQSYERWTLRSPWQPSDTDGDAETTPLMLCAHMWSPKEGTPKALCYFVHGMGEHAFAYRHLGQRLAASGIAMLSVDFYGHGLSDGPRLSTQFQQAVEDYCCLVDTTTAAPRFVGLPRFILGQSFGGLVASYVVRRDQAKWAGLLLSAAAIGVDWDAGKLVAYGVFSTLARLGYTPQWAVLPQFHGPELCRDAEGARNYDDDPLNYHGKLKVRIALQTMQAMRMNRPHFPEYTLPILCMHGTKDVTTSLAAAEAFVQAVSSADVTLLKLDPLAHLLFMEPERDRVMREVVDWISHRCATSASVSIAPAAAAAVAQRPVALAPAVPRLLAKI